MASAAAARPWVLLLLLLLLSALYFCSLEAQADTVNLCGLSPPGDFCDQITCFRYDPVCGANGVTYGCGCPEADCYGVPVVKLGEC